MKLESFKAGAWRQRYQYKSFEPALINFEWVWEDPQINVLLEQANQALGELNAFSLIVPDIDLFIRMHVYKEAQTSSRIEGTQTGIAEALMPEEQIEPGDKRDDWHEVNNYVNAVNQAITELDSLPLSNRLIKQTHKTLLSGVRGRDKQPGEFRTSQNWIGGSSLVDAAFIPPHPEGVEELMADLEKFLHNDTIAVPHLIRAAISHYQFETIHPFLDGNGRIGRLIIPLYLVSHGLLSKHSLYLSDFFERNRSSYYDALMRGRTANDLIHWVRFFLKGVAETANKGRNVFGEILKLRIVLDRKMLDLGKQAVNGHTLLNFLYKQPIITASDVQRELGVSQPTADALIRNFRNLDILTEVTGRSRWRAYEFQSYIRLFAA